MSVDVLGLPSVVVLVVPSTASAIFRIVVSLLPLCFPNLPQPPFQPRHLPSF